MADSVLPVAQCCLGNGLRLPSASGQVELASKVFKALSAPFF